MDPEVVGPFEGVEHVGVVGEVVERGHQLWSTHEHAGCTHLGDGEFGDGVEVVEHRLMQLSQAALAQGDIGRPCGGVEGMPSGGDRPLDVGDGGVGGHTEDLLGGRIDVRIGRAPRRLDQLTVDQEAFLVPQLGHVLPRAGRWERPRVLVNLRSK